MQGGWVPTVRATDASSLCRARLKAFPLGASAVISQVSDVRLRLAGAADGRLQDCAERASRARRQGRRVVPELREATMHGARTDDFLLRSAAYEQL
eukprot:3251445-Pleurochrysis_carterae.AAC.10